MNIHTSKEEYLEAEIKRLHEANQEMLDALRWIDQYYRIERKENHMVAEHARAAIAKGEQQ